jgi:hypothetical protein
MKNTLLFCIAIVCLFHISLFNLIASQSEFSSDVGYYIVMQDLQPSDVSALQLTCKGWNASFDYWMLNPEIVQQVNQDTCTKALCSFVHLKNNSNFLHFFNNNKKTERVNALTLLGWQVDSGWSTEQLMHVYCAGFNTPAEENPNWDGVFNNKTAITILCLSDTPNARYKYGNTVLIEASTKRNY